MKKVALLIVASFVVLSASAVLAGDGAVIETLNGEYLWNRQDQKPGPIKAVFVATDENQWNVSFYFNFDNKDHVYSGTASGSLSEGALRGKVLSDDEEQHPFVFEGMFVDGVFEGTHRTDGEDSQETGTIRLSR